MKEITQPEVDVLDYTGAGSDDPLYAAKKLIYTKMTRLEQGTDTWKKIHAMTPEEVNEQLDYIAKSVRTAWEFVSFTFQIRCVGRGFTHQLVRTRTASYQQQSQRVLDVRGFDYVVPPAIEKNTQARAQYAAVMEMINEGYGKLIDMGMPVQDSRGILPTNVGTSICMEVNLRTLADLAGKRDNPRAEGEYFKVFQAMREAALEVMPWIEPFISPERTKTPALDEILTQLRGDDSPVNNKLLNDAMKELDLLKGTWG